MKPTNKIHRSRVDWETIKEEDFNRLVESLLTKLHQKGPGQAVVIDGRGGDKGIDVAVWEGGKVVTVYQLKYYPQGFTGGHKRSRQPKVKESFETAWKHHAPSEWILVMPKNPHLEEKVFVDGLPAGRPVQVDIWGRARLDTALANYPALERAALRQETEDNFVQMHQERAALIGPNDLHERVEDLGELAGTKSQYWDIGFSYIDGEYEENYRPKHPDAMEIEPIKTKAVFTFGAEHADTRAKVLESMEYGTFEPITVPPGVARFIREGPSWVQPLRHDPTSRVEIAQEPQISDKRELFTFNFVDADGYSKGRFEGVVIARASGNKGAQVKVLVANIVTLIIKVSRDPEETEGGLNIDFNLIGAPVSDAKTALNLWDALRPDRLMELYFHGELVSKNRLGSKFTEPISDPYTNELLDDLCTLQQRLPGATFIVPEETTNRDRAQIRVTRLLLDGGLVFMPPEVELTATLSGENSERLRRFIRDGGSYLSQIKAFRTEIQGSKYNLGPASLFHRNLRVVDAEKVLQALESGTAERLVIKMRPKDDVLIQAWLGETTDTGAPLPPYMPWNLSGFEDWQGIE